MKATDHLNFINDLNFYYSTTVNNFNNDSNIVPRVENNYGDKVTLIYSSNDMFDVLATFNNNTGLLNFSKNASELLNSVSSVTWEQYTVNMSLGQDCDVWSLDNVAVSVQYEGCTRKILEEDFDSDFK